MTSIIENGTAGREADAIQTIDFNAEQPLRQPLLNGNGIMPGSPTAAVTSSPGTGNPATTHEPQTLNYSQGRITEVSIEAHAQTANPVVSIYPGIHENVQKEHVLIPSDATQYHTQTPSNQESNVNIASELSTSSGSEAATVITITNAPVPAPAVLPSVLDVSEPSNISSEISNGLPLTPILADNTDMKAITEIKATLNINTSADSCSTSNSDMEIDDELQLQPSPSDTAPGSGSLNPDITTTCTSVSENISIPPPRVGRDKSILSESVSASQPGGAIEDNTKVDPPSNARTSSQNTSLYKSAVLQPKENFALRVGVEHALRSLVGETAIDSKLILRLARELKWAKNQNREVKDNTNGGEEGVQPLNVPDLITECNRANNEVIQLRKQLSDAVVANQKFELELSKLKNLFTQERLRYIFERNRELEVQLGQSQNQRDNLAKKCEFLQNELNKFINTQNAVGPGAVVRVNRTQSQSPMNSPAATGSSTGTPINRQQALIRRPSILSHHVSEGAGATSVVPSQSPRQGMPMLSPAGTGPIASGSTPTHTRNAPIVVPPRPQISDVVSTPPLRSPAQGMFEHQLQQMSVIGHQRQQQMRHSNPAVPSTGQLSPAYQQPHITVPHQMQFSNPQNSTQSYLSAAKYTAYVNSQMLRQQVHSLPGMVPRNVVTDQRPVMPPGPPPSQSGEGRMQMQLRQGLPPAPFSGSGAPRTQPPPPTILPQQLPSQPQPQRIPNQTAPSFGQPQPFVQNGRGLQPQQHQIHYATLPPTPMTTASSPGSPSIQNPPHPNSHVFQPQPKEIPLKPSNVITTPKNLAQPPHAPSSYPPQSYIVSPSQVSAQPYALQATEAQHFVPQNTQAITRTTDASRTVIDLTADETEETDIEEPPKKRQKVAETQTQAAVATLTAPGPTLDENRVIEDGVESAAIDAGQPVEITPGQADAPTTMVVEPKNEPQPQLLIDGLDILNEEFTVLFAAVFQDSENGTSTCFFCADRKEDGSPEIHLQNPAVEDMANHLKEIHPDVWGRVCCGDY